MKKRFIEYDLPLAEISDASAHEKNVHIGLPPQFHVWWARRPLASSRATAFAALIDDPGPDHPQKRQEIMDLVEQITPWEAVKEGNSPAIERAREVTVTGLDALLSGVPEQEQPQMAAFVRQCLQDVANDMANRRQTVQFVLQGKIDHGEFYKVRQRDGCYVNLSAVLSTRLRQEENDRLISSLWI